MFIGAVATGVAWSRLAGSSADEIDVPLDCEYVCELGAALLGLRRLQARVLLFLSG